MRRSVSQLAAVTTPWILVLAGCGSDATRQPTPTRQTPVATAPAAKTLRPRDLAPLLGPIRERHRVPALAAAAVRGDRLLGVGVVGVRRAGSDDAALGEDRFNIGSCTKSMTATLLALLVEEGRLSWDTTLGEALPELAESMAPAYRPVTLVQLLGHRAGLRPYLFGKDSLNAVALVLLGGTPTEQRAAATRIILKDEPVAPPGTRTIYSNGAYAVAGHIAERAAGVPWEALIRERLFKPLQMDSAGFGWPATTTRSDQPWGHFASRPDEPVPPGHVWRMPDSLAPAGGVHCSVRDFARYAAFHLQGIRGRASLLKAETFTRLHTEAGGKGSVHALGWEVRPEKKWAGPNETPHLFYGGTGTFISLMVLFPERDLAVVVMTNSGAGEPACDEAVKVLLEELRVAP
jgi:CubicO group peptidase (beta-lactamase class C family)